MFDMKGEELEVFLVNPAVFAAGFRTLPNQGPGWGIDHHAPEDSTSLCRALDLSNATKVPKAT